MTFRAIRWLNAYLRPHMDLFEYGAGGSTMFFAKRVRAVVSIESDPSWHDLVARALRDAGISNCDLRLFPAEPLPSDGVAGGPQGDPYVAQEAVGYRFEAYVRSIDEYPDRSFDLVSVDGYARPACILHAIPKVRPGGYLLLDNADWGIYSPIMARLAQFPRADFVGVGPFRPMGWQTSVWRL